MAVPLKYFSVISYMNAHTQVYQQSTLHLEELLPRATFHKSLTEKYEGRRAEEKEMMFVASAFC